MARQNTIETRIRADGSQARREINAVGQAAVDMERKVSKPLRVFKPSTGSSVAASSMTSMLSASIPAPVSRQPYRPMFSQASAQPFMGVGMGRIMSGIGSAMSTGASILGSMASGVSGGGIASAGASILGAFGSALGIVGSIAGTLIGAAGKFGGMILDFLGKGVDLLMGLPKLIGGGLLAAGTAVAGGLYATHKALSPAAEVERYKMQLGAMGKPELMDAYMAMSREKGGKSVGEIASAGVRLESMGLDSRKWIKPLQDSVAMFPEVEMKSIATAIARFKSGDTGEALERLRDIGVTKDQLKSRGVTFDASNMITSDIASALDAIMGAMQERSGGMSSTAANGYEGAVAGLGKSIHNALYEGFKNVLPYVTESVNIISGTIGELGSKLASVDWSVVGTKVVEFTKATADLISYLASPKGFAEFGAALSQTFSAVAAGIGGVMQSIAIALYESLKAGGDWIMGKLLNWTDILVLAFQTAGGTVAALLEHAIVKGGNSISALLGASLISILPSIALDDKGKKLKKMGFGERVELLTSEAADRSGPTIVETLSKALNQNIDTERRKLGMGEGLSAWGKVGELAKQLGIDASSTFMKLLEKAQAEAAAKASSDKGKDEAAKQQQKTEEVVAAVKAGNALASQMLREIQAMNEYSQSEMAEAVFA